MRAGFPSRSPSTNCTFELEIGLELEDRFLKLNKNILYVEANKI